MKRISYFLVAVMVFSTIIAGAAPFSDVPFSHWSYDAVNKLAAKGILQGYPDGTFKGNSTVTRYALAMVTAKMLANVEQMMESGIGTNLVSKADLQTLEKLTVEFADELAMLGVKVTSLEDDMAVVKEDVSMLKKDVEGVKDYMAKGGMEKVKISGDMIVRHSNLIHRNDWAVSAFGTARAGNSNNSLTESQLRFKFTANIDENITAVARWVVFAKNSENVNGIASARGGAYGIGGLGNLTASDNVINLANLNIKNMFRFGGDFTFGRVIYNSNHGLLLDNYLDVARYTKRVADVDVLFQAIYDRHQGSYKDDARVDFRPVWNLDLKTKYHDHNLYLGLYAQAEPNHANLRPVALKNTNNFALQNTIPTAAQLLADPTVGAQNSDKRWDVEFGSKGPFGKCGHFSYDIAFVYTNYNADMVNDATTAGNPYISPEMKGWMGYVAANWNSKKQWAAKASYNFADDESLGAYSSINDMRYVDFSEVPTEDIGRGNQYFTRGLRNMSDMKLQAEYKPTDSKHYFRLAGDLLDELKNAPVNDLNRYIAGNGRANSVPVANKTNTAYDRYNNLGIADPKAVVLTFEYRYQLATNTRIRVGYTQFDLTGDAKKIDATPSVSAGRGWNNDYDYNFFWTEIYSKF